MSAKVIKLEVGENIKGLRLDIFLVDKIKLNRSQIQKLIDQDLVFVNDKLPKKAGDRIKTGDEILVKEPNLLASKSSVMNKETKKLKKEEIQNISIVSEADDYLVINKPSGLLVHPTEAHEPNTLTDWLVDKYPKIKKVGDSPERPGIVHRLDKEASGLLVIAKTQKMFNCLKKQFQARTIDKEYYVLVHGVVKKDQDMVDFDIDRGSGGRMVSRPKVNKLEVGKVKDIQEGKEAITEIFVEKRFVRYTLLRVKIYTGRTNQIRVHMLAYSHPIVGDALYFNRKLNRKRDLELGRVFLHAIKLCFEDLSGERKCFESKLPKELNDLLKKIN